MTDNNKNFLTGYSQFLDRYGGHFTYAALSTYRNYVGELSQKEKDYFRRHLDTCQLCSERLNEIAEVEGDKIEIRPKKILRIPPAVFRYAIAALLIFAVGITVILVTQKNREEKIASQEIPTDQTLAAATPDPEKFVSNQVLENFIGRTVRSSSGITLIAPNSGDTLTVPFRFKWKGNVEGKRLVVTLVDNKNNERWKVTSSSSELISEKKLEPGLYYIKLSTDEKLVQVGKFVVVR